MIYISSSLSSHHKIKDAILELIGLGFSNIELSGGTSYYQGINEDVLSLKQKHKLNLRIHNYFPPEPENFVLNIASCDKIIRNKTFEFIENIIHLSKILGNDLCTVHPGLNKSLLMVKDGVLIEKEHCGKLKYRDNTKEDFYLAVKALSEKLRTQQMRIGIENFFPLSESFYSFLDKKEDIIGFLEFCRDIPNVGFLLDLAHLNVAANYFGFDKLQAAETIFDNYPDKIFEIHLSENKGDVDSHYLSPLDSWQIKLLHKRKKTIKDIPIVFEWRGVSNASTYEHFLELSQILQ